jgi:hypothetical protein
MVGVPEATVVQVVGPLPTIMMQVDGLIPTNELEPSRLVAGFQIFSVSESPLLY